MSFKYYDMTLPTRRRPRRRLRHFIGAYLAGIVTGLFVVALFV